MSKFQLYVLSLRHKARVWRTNARTDRQTDRQNYDPQDRASIAAARGKIVVQFQSRHNTHIGHCYVMSFAAGNRLDVIIAIMKTV